MNVDFLSVLQLKNCGQMAISGKLYLSLEQPDFAFENLHEKKTLGSNHKWEEHVSNECLVTCGKTT